MRRPAAARGRLGVAAGRSRPLRPEPTRRVATAFPAGDLEIAAAGHLPESVDDWLPWSDGAIPPVALDPAVVIIGRVVDKEGRPAAGAEVAVFAVEDSWFPALRAARSARVARVSARGGGADRGPEAGLRLPSGGPGPGFAPAWLTGRTAGGPGEPVPARARPGQPRVRAASRTAQGRPVADAEVSSSRASACRGAGRPGDPRGGVRALAVTAADGGFAFAEVPPDGTR